MSWLNGNSTLARMIRMDWRWYPVWILILGSLLGALLVSGCSSQTMKHPDKPDKVAEVIKANGTVVQLKFEDGSVADALNPIEGLKVGDRVSAFCVTWKSYPADTGSGTWQVIDRLTY